MIRPLAALVMLAAASVSAEERRFYEREAEGWFWYQDPPPEPEEPEPEPPTPAGSAAAPSEGAAEAGPPAFSSAWLKTAIPEYTERAIDEPTIENVRAALYLHRLASDKAAQYAELSQQVTLGDPFLDAEFERPLANFAAQEVDRAALLARRALLEHLSAEIGVLWFYASDCPYCERQAPIMRGLENTSGLDVLTVSLDGLPMPSGAFADRFVVDRGQAAQLGVRTTPAIFLMRPASGEFEQVSQGMMELSDLEERVLLIAHRRGWISEEAWQATRVVRRTTVAVAPADLDPSVLDDPEALVAYLRDAMKRDP
jgi:conjugal transfer pilus assembly protein TraF